MAKVDDLLGQLRPADSSDRIVARKRLEVIAESYQEERHASETAPRPSDLRASLIEIAEKATEAFESLRAIQACVGADQ